MEAVLQGRGLRRNFGQFWAVDGIDINLEPGKIVGLIGPNGAGKTTLLLMLAGMLAPTEGSITVAGMDFHAQARQARALIGWLPDTFGSWGQLKVKEILQYFGRLYGLDKDTAAARAGELLELVHLEDMAENLAHVLSRGQKQRLGVARTLLANPKVLLLDEPAAGMDPKSRIELRELLRRQAESGVAVLISSHILTELEDMVDTAVFVQKGKVVDTSQIQGIEATAQTPLLRYQFQVINPDQLTALIKELAPHEVKQTSATTAEITVADEKTAAAWLKRLVNAGLEIVSFTPSKQSLEDLYLQIDQGEQQ